METGTVPVYLLDTKLTLKGHCHVEGIQQKGESVIESKLKYRKIIY